MKIGSLKSLLSLWENLARNRRYQHLMEECDINTFLRRADNEGLSFLTVTLPLIGKALDTFHSTNEWKAPDQFKTDPDGIPLFMGKAIRWAIDGNSVAVDCVRQLSYIFYKLEVQHDKDKVANYLDQFINTDKDIGHFDFTASDPVSGLFNDPELHGSVSTGAIVKEMRGLIHQVLANADPFDIRPCHGGGATACRTPNHKKWSTIRYFPKLDASFDYASHFFYNSTHLSDELKKLEDAPHADPCARVCLVPKDSRGPRIISCEPAELMYIQQGLMRKLYETIEAHPLTHGCINFTDQAPNREMARIGSITNLYATLDLKDASDRVSLQLVRSVFPSNWLEALEACRSDKTLLPDGRVVELNKFAPMGSACCFPVEALVFWACAVATLRIVRLAQLEHMRRTCDSYAFFKGYQAACDAAMRLRPDIFVYGDDIICDVSFSRYIMDGLESIGLLINRNKSYVDGPFRESCGGDYHNGYDVTPVRVRKELSSVGTGLQAGADLANEFIAKFGFEDSHRILRVIEESVGYAYPRTLVDMPMSFRIAPGASNDALFVRRWNNDLQRFEYRCLVLRPMVLTRREPDWFELLRKELSRGRVQSQDRYANPLAIMESKLDPGQYAVTHSARKKWAWVWLG